MLVVHLYFQVFNGSDERLQRKTQHASNKLNKLARTNSPWQGRLGTEIASCRDTEHQIVHKQAIHAANSPRYK
jgi:hypothetical protein